MKNLKILIIALFLLTFTSCEKKEPVPDKLERIEGLIQIDGDTIKVDRVKVVDTSNEKLVKELGLKDEDLHPAYYIYNPEVEYEDFKLADKAYFIFTDTEGKYIDEDIDSKEYITDSRAEFMDYLENTYSEFPIKVPYILYIRGEKIEVIYEYFPYTI